MANEKLTQLQQFVQSAADTAWEQKMSCSRYDTMPKSFGTRLEKILSFRSDELSILLNDIASEEIKKQEQTTPQPPDFSKYIRYSNDYLTHKEVFVGDKWVVVPVNSIVNFSSTTTAKNFGFSVTIKHGSDYANFTFKESLQSSYQQDNNISSLQGEKLHVELQNDNVSKEEFNWMHLGGQVFNKTKSNLGLLDGLNSLYTEAPKKFKRNYAYKINRVTKAVGKPVKSGKIFHGAEKLAKNAGKIAKVGPYLSAGVIAYEFGTGTENAHTYVDTVLLVVGVTALWFGAPVVVVGLAIYGILDYAFGISEGIDENFGRESGFWDKKSIYSFPKDNKPLFNKIEIDNTYVAPKFKKLPPKFKD